MLYPLSYEGRKVPGRTPQHRAKCGRPWEPTPPAALLPPQGPTASIAKMPHPLGDVGLVNVGPSR